MDTSKFIYMEKSRSERERPERKLQRFVTTVRDTVDALKSIPRKYNTVEWLVTHQQLLLGLQEGSEATSKQLLLPPSAEEEQLLALEELFIFESRFNHLIKEFKESPNLKNYASNPRRRSNLQLLNNHIFHRYAQLCKIQSGDHHTLIQDLDARAFWENSFSGVRFLSSSPLFFTTHSLPSVSKSPLLFALSPIFVLLQCFTCTKRLNSEVDGVLGRVFEAMGATVLQQHKLAVRALPKTARYIRYVILAA